MPRTAKEILEQATELAARFEAHDPNPAEVKNAASLRTTREAFQSRAGAERRLVEAVSVARAEGHSWAAIGAMIGTSGEAARQRYGKVVAGAIVSGGQGGSAGSSRAAVSSSPPTVLDPTGVAFAQADGGLYDEPIRDAAEDLFRRDPLAARIAGVLGTMAQGRQSSVVAVVGPWGSGKTSLLGLVRGHLEARGTARCVEFNPWMVASLDGLVADFFSTVLAGVGAGDDETKRRARSILSKYGRAASPLLRLIPVAGAPLAAVGELAAELSSERSLAELHNEARQALEALDLPLLVVVDDIDRLQGDELLSLFKLIRLVGRLPNVHYLLAFDDETVTEVLRAQDLGRTADRALSFLEKIVQVRVDIPPLHDSDIDALFAGRCSRVTAAAGIALAPHEQRRLEETYERLLREELRQPRQIKRLMAQMEATLPLVAGEVNFVDFLLVTFLRVSYPALYGKLAQSGERLSYSLRTAFEVRNKKRDERRRHWEEFVANAGISDVADVLALLAELFPAVDDAVNCRHAAEQLLSAERRVGAPEYFDRYFQLGIPPGDVPDARLVSALLGCVGPDGSDGDREWLIEALRYHRELALRKIRAAWSPADVDEAVRLINLLGELYDDFREYRGELLGPALHLEWWTGELFAKFGEEGVEPILSAALARESGRRLVCRALAHAAREDQLAKTPGYLRACAIVGDLLRGWLRAASDAPIENEEAVVWMLHDAVRFVGTSDVRAWLSEVLDVTAWNTHDLVGCFTPLAYMAGIPEPFLSDFALGPLVELVPLQTVFDRLAPELDVVADTALNPGAMHHDRDTSFAHRVEIAIGALAQLRRAGPSEPEPAPMAIDALHPLRWMAGTEGELVLRVAVALPAMVPSGPTGREALRVSTDAAADRVERVVNESVVASWLASEATRWNAAGEATWRATAGGGPDLVELLFVPPYGGSRPPMTARCGVHVDRSQRGPDGEGDTVRVILDVAFNLLELDEDRRPADKRHATTTPPAPAALSVDEVAGYLHEMIGVTALAERCARVFGMSTASEGEVGLWLVLHGVTLDRVLDLRGLEQRAGAAQRSEWGTRDSFPLTPSVWGVNPETGLVTRFVQHVLETSGFRDLAATLARLRERG